MLNVTKELTALARKLGYTGKAPDTVAKAINAITASVGEGGGEGGGGCDCDPGYEMVETQLFSETVTTVNREGILISTGVFAYDSQINSPSLTVTFNGTDYQCTAVEMDGAFVYGGLGETGPDFTNYPFTIVSSVDIGGGNEIYTEVPGTYSIVASGGTVVVSSDFKDAVNKSIALPLLVIDWDNTTFQEVENAVIAGKIVYSVNMIARGENSYETHIDYVVSTNSSDSYTVTFIGLDSLTGDPYTYVAYADNANSTLYN